MGAEKVRSSRLRKEGFCDAIRGVPGSRYNALLMDEENAREKLHRHLNDPDPVTAIFCYNDNAAWSVIAMVEDVGLSVPGDISIVGFDNPPSHESGLALTTFDPSPFTMGTAAARFYLERIASPGDPGIRRVGLNSPVKGDKPKELFRMGPGEESFLGTFSKKVSFSFVFCKCLCMMRSFQAFRKASEPVFFIKTLLLYLVCPVPTVCPFPKGL